jgi:histidinol-phosphate aminotransferase
VVVVDEAYIDFAHASQDASACKLLKEHRNIIVLQTLSKAFGLAGIRWVGGWVARPSMACLASSFSCVG